MLSLFIPGRPIQQGSMIARLVHKGGRPRAVMHSHASDDLKAWRADVAEAVAERGHPEVGPYVTVAALFQMPKPATTKYPEYPAGPPDLDKLERALGDALTASGLIADDARIVRWEAEKVWAGGRDSRSDEPGLWLTVTAR